ncbi:MAG: hypothetical protein ACPGJI_07580 [Kangiellaceae bacterium]
MTILSLWLPILVSAIGVFIVSSIIHMVLGYHRNNFQKLPNEEEFLVEVGKLEIEPGEYMYPFCSGPKDMQSEGYMDKLNKGPVGMMTAMPKGPFPMGKNLLNWFIYSLIVGAFSAYIALQSLSADSSFNTVMHTVTIAAFAGYALALIQNSVWYNRAWRVTAKFMFDGLVYSLTTGAVFSWLW